MKLIVLQRDAFIPCYSCGTIHPLSSLVWEHKVAVAKFGPTEEYNTPENIGLICASCDPAKTSLDRKQIDKMKRLADARLALEKKVTVPGGIVPIDRRWTRRGARSI